MKFAAIILASLTIFLTAIPCDDENSLDSTQIEFSAKHSNSGAHDLVDFCTPFCSCSCCSTIIINPTSNQYALRIDFYCSELNSNYNSNFSNNLVSRFFQPPQA